jgi:hypothetical protein
VLEKINKPELRNKPKKKKDDSNTIMNERENSTIDALEMQRIMRDSYDQLYTSNYIPINWLAYMKWINSQKHTPY